MPKATNYPYIFVSYSRADSLVAQNLVEELQKHHIPVWLDENDLTAGTLDWEEAIRVAIKSASAVILLASPESRQSRYVRDELAIAEYYGRKVYPFWVNGKEWIDCIPLGWGSAQCIDARGKLYQVGLDKIVELFSVPDNTIPNETNSEAPKQGHIFLSYNYKSKHDTKLASIIEQKLTSDNWEVSVDDQASLPLGTEGANIIRRNIGQSRFFIVLVSEESANNELMREQLQYAHRAFQLNEQPEILPVRVRYSADFPYHLRPYLEYLPWAKWTNSRDTESVLQDIINALEGGKLSYATRKEKEAITTRKNTKRKSLIQPTPFADPKQIIHNIKNVTGTVDPTSNQYLERDSDQEIQHELTFSGTTVVIKAPRQMGKSSLLVRNCYLASQKGISVAFVDFQLMNNKTLKNEESLFKWFARRVAQALQINNIPDIGEMWDAELGSAFLCTSYFEKYLLPHFQSSSLIVAIDECDKLFQSPYRSDFFGMLRHWHNSRSYQTNWKNVHIHLIISTEPYLLIENINQSPFNVGKVITLGDFTEKHLSELNKRYETVVDPALIPDIYEFTGGHPYLVQETIYQLASQNTNLDELYAQITKDSNPYIDHLLHYLFLLSQDRDLVETLQKIMQGESIASNQITYRLQSAGLIKNDGKHYVMRCKLYQEYFSRRLIGNV